METESIENRYAGFWARLAAYIIDSAIFAFLMLQTTWFVKEQLNGYFLVHPEMHGILQGGYASTESLAYLKFVEVLMYYYTIISGFIFNWVYYAGFESSHLCATPGKWLLGIYVTGMEGRRISFARASGRHFSKLISGILLGIGYMMTGFTERFQALHDKMAETLVWRK